MGSKNISWAKKMKKLGSQEGRWAINQMASETWGRIMIMVCGKIDIKPKYLKKKKNVTVYWKNEQFFTNINILKIYNLSVLDY